MAGIPSKREPTATSPQLRQLLLALRAALTERYGADLEDIVLFGSEARGEAHEGSDVDVALVLRLPV